MKKGVLRDFLILLGIAVLLLLTGYYLARKIWDSGADLSYKVSYEQEDKLGEGLSDLVLKQFTALKNRTADSALDQITGRLINALDSSRYRYQFVILKSDQINAFTIPGGNIFVFSGLIEFTESPEELAAVLAHEIGHAEKRHVVSRLVNELSIAVLLSGLSNGDPSLVARILKEIIGNGFDREQENQADQFGLRLLERARISPKSLARFFERLETKGLDYDESLELLMNHPHNSKRIDQARRFKTKNDFQPVPFNIDWKKVKKSIKE